MLIVIPSLPVIWMYENCGFLGLFKSGVAVYTMQIFVQLIAEKNYDIMRQIAFMKHVQWNPTLRRTPTLLQKVVFVQTKSSLFQSTVTYKLC